MTAERTPEIIEKEIKNLEEELRILKSKTEHEQLEKFMETAKGKWFKDSGTGGWFFKIIDVKFNSENSFYPAKVNAVRLQIYDGQVSVENLISGFNGIFLTSLVEVDEKYVIDEYNNAITKINNLVCDIAENNMIS